METTAVTKRGRLNKRFPLSAQIAAAFGTVVLLLAAVATLAYVQLTKQGSEDFQIMSNIYEIDAKMTEVKDDLYTVRMQGLRLATYTDAADIADGWAIQQENYTAWETAIGEFNTLYEERFGTAVVVTEEEQAAWGSYKDAQASLYDPTYEGDPVDADTRREIGDTVVANINSIQTQIDEQVTAQVEHVQAQTAQTKILVIAIAAIAVAA
ncbi:hypothetical protein, partial [Demequina salsinemoris]|uniref:hypothetical protein n=1 Tax=Demequina salsinemoris TaxID=577470 RepID=UPI00128E3726